MVRALRERAVLPGSYLSGHVPQPSCGSTVAADNVVSVREVDLDAPPLAGRRVLHLVPDLLGSPGGIARHGQAVCRALSDLGCSISIIALNDARSTQQAMDELPSEVRYIACAGSRVMFVRQALEAVRERPELVLVEHANFSALGWFVAYLARAPLVVFAHGIETWSPLSTTRQLAFRRADRILAVSRLTMERAAASNRVSLRKVRVLHNCLNLVFDRPQLPVTTDAGLSLLTVSRLSATEGYKGHDRVIRCLPALLQEFPSLGYDVVGDGDRRSALELLAAELGVAHAVRFHGKVSEEALHEYYERASVFVMPSQAEGFGYVFVEAMAHRKPVVAGDRDAAVEVVRDGETGFLVDPEDEQALTDRLARLLRDAELRERMGAAGLSAVRTEFSFETFRRALGGHMSDVLVRDE